MKIFLGDNQFLGINHASESRAIERAIKFQDIFAISEIVKTAQLLSYDGFFCTLHEKFVPFYKLCSNDNILQNMPIHACLPYAHKYSEMVTQHGWLGSLKHLGKYNAGNLILGGVSAYLGKDLSRLIRGVIGSELSFVKDLNLESIYIQNVATDFLLGLGAFDVLSEIVKQIHTHFNKQCGLITFNPIMAVKFIKDYNLDDVVTVCTSINVSGFRMNPSREEVEYNIKESGLKFMGMSIFSSGVSSPTESLDYIKSLKLDSVVLGASSPAYLKKNINILKSI